MSQQVLQPQDGEERKFWGSTKMFSKILGVGYENYFSTYLVIKISRKIYTVLKGGLIVTLNIKICQMYQKFAEH